MNTWDNLPNAKHIDWVLADVKRNPKKWDAARVAAWDAVWDAARGAARGAARDAARGAARDAAWSAAYDAARGAAWDAARDAARDAAWGAVWDAAWVAAWAAARGTVWGACAVLIAWDYAGDILSMEPDAVRLLASAGDHAAVLMLPAVIVKHSKE